MFDDTTNKSLEKNIFVLQETIRSIRNLRAEANLTPQVVVPHLTINPTDQSVLEVLAENEDIIRLMSKVGEISFESRRPGGSLVSVLPWCNVYLIVGDIIDISSELERLRKEKEGLLLEEQKSLSKLSNESFLQKAPQEVVEKEQNRLKKVRERMKRIDDNIASLERSSEEADGR
jgi:valyl-tRNA synthetase